MQVECGSGGELENEPRVPLLPWVPDIPTRPLPCTHTRAGTGRLALWQIGTGLTSLIPVLSLG